MISKWPNIDRVVDRASFWTNYMGRCKANSSRAFNFINTSQNIRLLDFWLLALGFFVNYD